ncbi:LacI family DNA-binding transcriptional regulator [Microbacterium esteraromaticum]|uniref:LacI family DNA-binding transcriptional regulator n=1 Tax=Microbacterium esteraromaticum TaxID=57043 RepID=A0A939DVC2_9MICO|nr:LacI family DNA-binding transcriptional regulator [Microbacterium esteraromaticum]MBN8204962.1 LacI family DNA-binding transcriptional regulator [Microbacterium esteraromaticum]MBN8415116.1 LacI family DNA-binding transcriptional regulator [Microbacterium esteraromaticum]
MSPRHPSEDRAPNQVDVARMAGVSTQTVSRVMSGQQNVRPETARRVLAAVEELGYRVHAAAASLASGRSRILGVIVVSTDRYSTAAVGVGIEQAAAAHRYTVTTASVADHASPEAFIEAFDRLERQGAEGIVLGVPVELDSPAMRLRTDRTPSTRNERASVDPDAPLLLDQHAIARLAVEHLLDLGHKTVWHVPGDEYWLETQQRQEAWEQVLTERGITPPPVIAGDWTPESGYRAGRIIASIPDATAVFVSSDEMAFGLIRALHEAGRSVPEDVSVVSVDDIALAGFASPALTTVRQPFEQMGRAAALRLISQLEGTDVTDAVDVRPELIVRASTAPPRP